jgi:O-antigen ligase
MMAFLGAGIVVLLLGLAGASYGAGEVPTLRLGLAGLPVGGGVNTNALAATVLLVAPLGVSVLILRTREKADWLTLLPIATTLVVIGVVTLVACRSLSAGMAVWLILIGFLVRGMSSRRFRIVTSAIVVAPVLIASGSMLFQSEETVSRAASGWSRSARSRIPIMTHGLERWTESPWFGIGLNEFRSTYEGATDDTLPVERKDEGRDVAHAHNIFLQTALDVGAVGSAAYWGVLAFLLVQAGQAARGLSNECRSAAVGSAVSLVAVTLFGTLDAVPLGSKIGMFQWMASGLILAAWRARFIVPIGSSTAPSSASPNRPVQPLRSILAVATRRRDEDDARESRQ